MALYDSNIFGPMRYHSIQNFALQIYSRSGLQGDGTGPAEPMQDSVQSSEVQKEITVINTPEDWERECSKSYRGICVLAFFDSSSTTYDLNYMSTVMNSIISKMGKSVAAFRMLAADAYCQVSYTDMFGVSATSVPTVSIYSPMKGRYASFRGAFKEQTVQVTHSLTHSHTHSLTHSLTGILGWSIERTYKHWPIKSTACIQLLM